MSSGGGSGHVLRMEANNISGGDFTPSGQRRCGNTGEAIAWITDAWEHVNQLLVVQNVHNHLVNVVHGTRI